MRRWATLMFVMLPTLIAASAPSAPLRPPRQVSAAQEPIWVRLAPDQITRLAFPDPLTEQDFAVPPGVAVLKADPSDSRQLIIVAKAPAGETHLIVNTTRRAYVVAIRRADRAADSVVTVTPPPAPRPPSHPEPSPEAAMRRFWRAQWQGASASPDIRFEAVDGLLSTLEGQRTEYVAYQQGLGFYGWTLQVTNTSAEPQAVAIEALQDASGRLLSVMVQRARWPSDLGRLEPGESLRLHLAYMEEPP